MDVRDYLNTMAISIERAICTLEAVKHNPYTGMGILYQYVLEQTPDELKASTVSAYEYMADNDVVIHNLTKMHGKIMEAIVGIDLENAITELPVPFKLADKAFEYLRRELDGNDGSYKNHPYN